MVKALSGFTAFSTSSAPQIRYPDCYGIDMANLESLIAFKALLSLLKQTNQYSLIDSTYKKCKKQELLPKDLFEFKGIVCGGTDSDTYKAKIEHYYGIKPLEIFGGTESAAVATETWSRNGLTFFPDVNFLEFIPENELQKENKEEEKINNVTYIKQLKIHEFL